MRRLVFCLMGLALPAVAVADGPAEKPMLVLDAGGHTATVRKVLFSRDGKELITISYDKSIRFWDVSTGEPLRTLRPPAGPGPFGVPFAAALAPDGKTLAVGGYGLGAGRNWIHLIALPGGEVRRVLKGHTAGVTALAFSPDGRRLASASYDKTARVWEVDADETTLTLKGHDGAFCDVAWSPDGGRLATASADKTARLWSARTGKEEAVLRGHDQELICVDWSPDGKTIATGDRDGTIRLWDADGAARRTIDKLGLREAKSVHFSADSRRLLYAGSVAGVLDLDGDGRTAFGRHHDIVRDGAFSPDGALAATCDGAGVVYLWKPADGTPVRELAGLGRIARGAAWAAGDDGQTVLWGNATNKGDSLKATFPLEHSFIVPELRVDAAADRPARRAALTAGPSTVEVSADGITLTLRRGGDKVGDWHAQKFERVVCYTFLPGDRLAVATYYDLYLLDARTLKRLGTFAGHTGIVWAVAPSPDGRFLLSASADHTLRVWTLDRDEPLLSLFFAGDDWIAWTPEGYYAASPGGEELMGWQVDNGPEKMASYYPASQFRKTLYRPDVIKRLLTAGSVEKALSQADEERGKATRATEVAQVLPPKVAITSPKGAAFRADKAALHVEATATGSDNNPVSSLRLLLDGRPFGEDALQTLPRPEAGEARAAWDVDLPSGTHRLAVEAAGKASVGLSDPLEVVFTPVGQDPDKAVASSGSLYVLAIGINAYPGDLRLECAAPDARSVDEAFRKDSKALFKDVKTRLLVDDKAGRRAVLEGLDWLKDQAKPGDVVVVFYAGHGTTRKGRFYLLPADMDLKDIGGTGLSGDDLRGRLGALPCTALLVLDACYSGAFDQGKKSRGLPAGPDGLVRALVYDEGLVVMCGASKEQEAAEEKGHGFFTRALVEGLSGKAASKRDGVVYLTGLQQYVEERVAELSGGEQAPTLGKPSTVRSFPLAKP